ncbi:glycine zipper 2TM domain-containing protein [Porphyrobacter algicida]|uniref:17 kDa surface antigen n=1 Tax=Qipengyuania algicida TaxID=1836209 RepID=A0A845ANK3_9SPHN|nr:glycine zipper 2TM domain-containing protein [Qipengyuania algicida]MXP30076.1 glycine zipper 2TM domain-containing protein [Qipengyuania algicida]
MTISLKTAALALATGGLALASPVAAQSFGNEYAPQATAYGQMTFDHSRHGHHRHEYRGRGHDRDDYRGRYYNNYRQTYYGEPVHRNTRVWRGDDGRYYCRRSNGTTGLIIGAAGGALLGREVAGRRGDRTLGAILGGAAGALLGKSLDSGVHCR